RQAHQAVARAILVDDGRTVLAIEHGAGRADGDVVGVVTGDPRVGGIDQGQRALIRVGHAGTIGPDAAEATTGARRGAVGFVTERGVGQVEGAATVVPDALTTAHAQATGDARLGERAGNAARAGIRVLRAGFVIGGR